MENNVSASNGVDYSALAENIKAWGKELGFSQIGISDLDTAAATRHLRQWLAAGMHGEMDYMARHADLRADPCALVPGTLRVISARLPYWPNACNAGETLADDSRAYISRYALGRDYHKLVRSRLQQLADRISAQAGAFGYRVFSDSAPVLETDFARRAGLGWKGKHTLTLGREGSWHFLGEIYTELPLPPDSPVSEHCGTCTACMGICPTQAIVAPYVVDARRCISYLTIELHGAIPEPLRPLIGNRIYGCDDCQLVCPWNRFATHSELPDFAPRNGLDSATLAELFAWTEQEFLDRLAGSPIRRIGHERWLRNIAVAIGNARKTGDILAALNARADHPSPLVREHVQWARKRLAVNPA